MTQNPKEIQELIDTCKEFIQKVETGRAKSKQTYGRMKAAIEDLERVENTSPLRLQKIPSSVLAEFTIEFRNRAVNPGTPFDVLPARIVDSLCHGATPYEIIELMITVVDQQQQELARLLAQLPIIVNPNNKPS